MTFKDQIKEGIPNVLPKKIELDLSINHAPKREEVLSISEKKLAISNALRYFDKIHHKILSEEFRDELNQFGRIYMYRLKPSYEMYARAIEEYPCKTKQAGAIMLMIQNNLNKDVAQHPHELITYGGNGSVFQNWAQYRLCMKYLSEMNNNQTLVINSGHPLGLFPSNINAPRVVVSNGMMIPNYSSKENFEKFNALGVTQYGQMTAGSYMYIGPQGIVHGTTITVLNAFRKINKNPLGSIFVTSGLGGMSGAQPKAGSIAKCITVCAEVNPKVIKTRHSQGWVDEVFSDIQELIKRVKIAKVNKEVVSIAFQGNIITIWEEFYKNDVFIDIGSDQTSLHNPWSGGYYPHGVGFDDANEMISNDPDLFKKKVKESLLIHVEFINKHCERGTYFFDYGNAFLLEASKAGGNVFAEDGINFKFPSYVQDIMGPMCFDYGFGPFRWVCASNRQEDLDKTDKIACKVLENLMISSPTETKLQMQDNIDWIKSAKSNYLVVGSKARILYADSIGRVEIAKAFNKAIAENKIGTIILGRDHHDVSGTDSPYRETSNIYDGSKFTADMAIQNVIGDSFRGATWVSIHNGGGVGWGEVINGGFGMVIEGTKECQRKIESMLHWDVNNGVARRSWARNSGAIFAIKKAMKSNSDLIVTLPNEVDDKYLNNI
ncbi:MAG: urocanate hydratase [Flavobacteriales bacterium]|tara:strand:- start:19976 stop:21961 length:1986 start_codon:yes stop_codon:yes gene_type:complete